jgi:HK97 gp10 family phage protein
MPAWGIAITEDTFTPKLAGLTARMRENIVGNLDAVGAEIAAHARQIVPVRTGFLRDSIFHDIVESDLNLMVGATAPYASYVENGTWKMRARPFLRPSFDAAQQQILNALLLGVMQAFG